MNIEIFSIKYIKNLSNLLKTINDIIIALEASIKNKSKIYIPGNRGSFATTSHMVNDLGAGLRRDFINFDIIRLSDSVATTSATAYVLDHIIYSYNIEKSNNNG